MSTYCRSIVRKQRDHEIPTGANVPEHFHYLDKVAVNWYIP